MSDMIDINNVISFIVSPQISGGLLILKISFLIFTSILFGFIIFALIRTLWLKRILLWDLQEFLTYRPFGIRKIVKTWNKITKSLETGLESEYRLALIEADSVLDNIFKRMGYKGEALGERLDKLTSTTLPNLEQVREVHKIRNSIIHDPDYKLTLEEAKKALETYEQALRDLQVL